MMEKSFVRERENGKESTEKAILYFMDNCQYGNCSFWGNTDIDEPAG